MLCVSSAVAVFAIHICSNINNEYPKFYWIHSQSHHVVKTIFATSFPPNEPHLCPRAKKKPHTLRIERERERKRVQWPVMSRVHVLTETASPLLILNCACTTSTSHHYIYTAPATYTADSLCAAAVAVPCSLRCSRLCCCGWFCWAAPVTRRDFGEHTTQRVCYVLRVFIRTLRSCGCVVSALCATRGCAGVRGVRCALVDMAWWMWWWCLRPVLLARSLAVPIVVINLDMCSIYSILYTYVVCTLFILMRFSGRKCARNASGRFHSMCGGFVVSLWCVGGFLCI